MTNQSDKLGILILTGESNQSIPLRSQLAEVYGENIVRYGHKVKVILSTANSERPEKFNWNGIEFYRVPVGKRLVRARLIWQIIKEGNIDILQVRQGAVDCIISLFIRRRQRLPVVIQYTWPEWEAARQRYQRKRRYFNAGYWKVRITDFLQIKAMQNADLILPISEQMGEYLIKRGIPRQRVLPFMDGVNPEKFTPEISCDEIKTRFGLCDSPVLVYQGTMARIRQLEILMYAFSRVVKQWQEAKLLMVGEGDGRKDIHKLADGLGIGNSVVFTGRVAYEEVPKYIAASDIALCPIPPLYLYKLSSPLKLFEYMAVAKPVVANEEIPEQKETLEQSGGGILAQFTPEAFADAIIELLDNPEKAHEMGQKGRKWVVRNRRYEILARRIEQVYYQLLVRKQDARNIRNTH